MDINQFDNQEFNPLKIKFSAVPQFCDSKDRIRIFMTSQNGIILIKWKARAKTDQYHYTRNPLEQQYTHFQCEYHYQLK